MGLSTPAAARAAPHLGTLAIPNGVHPRTVREPLGHSTIAVTLGTYSHVTPVMHTEAAELSLGVPPHLSHFRCEQTVSKRHMERTNPCNCRGLQRVGGVT